MVIVSDYLHYAKYQYLDEDILPFESIVMFSDRPSI